MNTQRYTLLLSMPTQKQTRLRRPRGRTLSLPTAAQLLGRSWGQTWRLVLKGILPGSRIGGRWLVDARAVRELAQSEDRGTAERRKDGTELSSDG